MTDKPQFVGKKVKLGELCEICSGGTPKRSVAEYWKDGTIPWVKIGDMSEKYVSSTEERITDAGFNNSSVKMLEPGTLLYSIFASIGAVSILKIPATTNQAIAGLKIKDDSLDRDFLYHYLKSRESISKSSGRGAAQNNINLTILRNMQVTLPSIEIQRSIVRNLEMISNQVTIAESHLMDLDALVKSRFIEMFGDLKQGYSCSSCRLGSISRIGSSRRVFRNELLSEGIPFYRGTEIAALSMGSETSPSLFISKERYDELVAITGKPEVGDLLLPSICPDGQIWRVDTGKPFYFKDGRVLWIHPNREIVDSIFLRHALSILFQMSFSDIASGTTFAEMKIFLLKELEVPLPDITVQKKFAAFVAQVDKSRFGGMLRLLNSLSGIMHASFFSVADTD